MKASILAVAAILAVGCSTTTPSPSLLCTDPIPEGRSVVFGTVTLYGRPKTGGRLTWVNVINARTGINVFYEVLSKAETRFCWSLVPGDYAVLGLGTSDALPPGGFGKSGVARIYAEFSVSSAGQAIYVGDLELDASSNRLRVTIADNSQTALAKFRTDHPNMLGPVTKTLLKLEETR